MYMITEEQRQRVIDIERAKDKRIADLKAQVEKLNDEVKNYCDAMCVLENDKTMLRAQVAELEAETNEQNGMLIEQAMLHTNEVADLKAQVADVRRAMNEQIDDYTQSYHKLEAKLAHKDKIIDVLAETMSGWKLDESQRKWKEDWIKWAEAKAKESE